MGKSKGDPARSKSRPSSSSLAASFLQSSGGATVGFGGFVGSARVNSSLSLEPDAFSGVSEEVAAQLRRLSKKDHLTKLKALAALDALFTSLSDKELTSVIPYWVFEYRKLVHENNRQVRENTQKVMKHVVKIGRGLAPHIRGLMGAWWIAQFDPCREVANTAKESFQEAFSGQKRIEALVYCIDDIFAYLSENLKLTPQTILDKTIPIEESTEKHELVICSSLLATTALLDVLVASQKLVSKGTMKLHSGSAKIMESSALECLSLKLASDHKLFRDFLKSQRPSIRSAAYQALRALTENLPAAFTQGEMETTAKVVLGAFVEKDGSCMQSMWDMVLAFSKIFPQAWVLEGVKKIAFPRFWAFLRHGCYGSQSISSLCLLPLLSLIPTCAVLPVQRFLEEYFHSLWKGCSSGTFQDGIILLKIFRECFIWVMKNIRRYADGELEMKTLQNFLVDAILFKILWLNYSNSRMLQDPTENWKPEMLDTKGIPASDTVVVEGQLQIRAQIDSTLLSMSSQFVDELRDCLVDILDFLSSQESLEIWPLFQQDFVRILNVKLSKVPEIKESSFTRMTEFLLRIGAKLFNRENCRQQWPLHNFVQPFVGSIFKTITSVDDPEAVMLLAKLVSVFGPTAFSLVDLAQTKGFTIAGNLPASKVLNPVENISSCRDAESSSSPNLQDTFRNQVVPWCLRVDYPIESFKLDLLLSFFEDGSFRSEWDFVLFYVLNDFNIEDESQIPSIKQIDLLAALVGRICQKNFECGESAEAGSQGWDSTRLDAAVLLVAQNKLQRPSCSQLLRDAIVDPGVLSTKARAQVVEELLKHIHLPLLLHESTWTRKSAELILKQKANIQLHQPHYPGAMAELWEDAKFAICILQKSLASNLYLKEQNRILVKVLTTLFCLKWTITKPSANVCNREANDSMLDDNESGDDAFEDYEPNMFENGLVHKGSDDSTGFPEIIDDEVGIEREQSSVLSGALKFLDDEIFISFCKRVSINVRYSCQEILAQCVRFALFDEPENNCQRHAEQWAMDILVYFCVTAEDVQKVLDLLLASTTEWPFWAEASSNERNSGFIFKGGNFLSGKMIEISRRFGSFIDILSSNLGQWAIFLGDQVASDRLQISSELVRTALGSNHMRAWLVVELLCTWEWNEGNAGKSVLPFLRNCAKIKCESHHEAMLFNVMKTLFGKIINIYGGCYKSAFGASNCQDSEVAYVERIINALLATLKTLFEDNGFWGKDEAEKLFCEYFAFEELKGDLSVPLANIASSVLDILMPFLRKKSNGEAGGLSSLTTSGTRRPGIDSSVCQWLQMALSTSDFSGQIAEIEFSPWLKLAVSCFPLHTSGGAGIILAASTSEVTNEERSMLFALFQKIRIRAEAQMPYSTSDSLQKNIYLSQMLLLEMHFETTLARLIAVTVAYCWSSFEVSDWNFVLAHLHNWLEAAVVDIEELTELVADAAREGEGENELEECKNNVKTKMERAISNKGKSSSELTNVAVCIFSEIEGFFNLDEGKQSQPVQNLERASWKQIKIRALEDILRLFLATALAESVLSSNTEAAEIISKDRLNQSKLWESIADVVVNSSIRAREAAVRAADLWGLGKTSIDALYTLLFSSYPISSLQWASYHFLSTDPLCRHAITWGPVKMEESAERETEKISNSITSLTSNAHIRPDLAAVLETSGAAVLESPLTSPSRVNYLLAWSLFLTYLQSLTSLTSARERLVQYTQDSDSPTTLLDCLFQHIPLEVSRSLSAPRKRNVKCPSSSSVVAESARRAAATGAVLFAVEGLWPVKEEDVAILSGAIYGLMLRVLPACVRIWFTGLRDRSRALAIESFTLSYCSPELLAGEFYKVQAVTVTDENLSIRANQSSREVTATYKKEEAGVDIIIKFPACYPLRTVEVDCTRRMGISENRLRKWILSIAAFLRNQNGAVAEAIVVWKQNVDREFEGVEECPICYSIVHTSNHGLPRLACRTCKHKFHPACLYKWFSTSHKSTCPLCQTPF